jgi:hypothetical protein
MPRFIENYLMSHALPKKFANPPILLYNIIANLIGVVFMKQRNFSSDIFGYYGNQ